MVLKILFLLLPTFAFSYYDDPKEPEHPYLHQEDEFCYVAHTCCQHFICLNRGMTCCSCCSLAEGDGAFAEFSCCSTAKGKNAQACCSFCSLAGADDSQTYCTVKSTATGVKSETYFACCSNTSGHYSKTSCFCNDVQADNATTHSYCTFKQSDKTYCISFCPFQLLAQPHELEAQQHLVGPPRYEQM